MYINLNDLICYMDCYSNSYVDPNTYSCYYENDLSLGEDFLQYLVIPKVDESKIIAEYIQNINNKKIKKSLGNVDLFHRQLNDFNLYNDWIKFKTDFLIKVAAEWCNKNQLKYTLKN